MSTASTNGAARHRVVIVGGGFGGLPAARFLARKDVDVTWSTAATTTCSSRSCTRWRRACSPGQISPAIRHVLRKHKNVRVELAEVTGFDLDRRVVHASVAGRRAPRGPLRQPDRGRRGQPVLLRP